MNAHPSYIISILCLCLVATLARQPQLIQSPLPAAAVALAISLAAGRVEASGVRGSSDSTAEGRFTQACICPAIYDPVCDKKSGETYSNQCAAACVGIYGTNPGECCSDFMDEASCDGAARCKWVSGGSGKCVDGSN